MPEPTTAGLLLGRELRASQSGRTYPVGAGTQAALANRRDVRDAVALARLAARGWAAMRSDQRSAWLFAVEEELAGRRDELTDAVEQAEAVANRRAAAVVDQSLTRWLYYAGWADKLRFATDTVDTAPVGTVAVLAPQRSSLLGLVSVIGPALSAGATVVAVAAQERPLPALVVARALLAAAVPTGVVGLLTGRTAELAPWLVAHSEVDAVDLCGAPTALRQDLELAAAGTAKRLLPAPASEPDWTRPPGPARLRLALRGSPTGG